MLTIAIIGSNNVGKTSLFNYLTGFNLFIDKNENNFNLNNNYGIINNNNSYCICIDTCNILNFNLFNLSFLNKDNNLLFNIKKNFLEIIKNVNLIYFLISSLKISKQDIFLSNLILKKYKKKNIILVISKMDLYKKKFFEFNDFYSLGLKPKYFISIYNKNSILNLKNSIFNNKNIFFNKKSFFYKKILSFCFNFYDFFLKKTFLFNKINNFNIIKIIFLGKKNVGKSTLFNTFSRKYISLVSNINGITKSFVINNIFLNNINYLITDSPGLYKSYYNITSLKFKKFYLNFQVILYIIDINLGLSRYDLIVLNFLFKKGKFIILIFNKCDNFSISDNYKYKKFLKKMYDFIKYIDIFFIKAINIKRKVIYNIFKIISINYKNIFLNKLNNSILTKILIKAINNFKKKNIFFNNINLKYANIYKYYPLIIVIYGNKIKLISNFFKKYLLNFYMKYLKFKGFKIYLKFKEIYNPFFKKNIK